MQGLPSRAEVARLARRHRIEGYELEDLIQEVYVALLEGYHPDTHLRRLGRKATRNKPRIVYRGSPDTWDCDLPSDDARTRTDGDLDALVLMIASEAESDDGWLLERLSEGTDYRELCAEWHCSEDAAWQRVCRFRNRLYPRLYPEGQDVQ